MDIKLSHRLLKTFLTTSARPDKIGQCLALCGPTVDRVTKTKNDFVYDIEIINNRIDSASAFGIAREAAAILPQFDTTASLNNDPYQLTLDDLPTTNTKSNVNVQILDNSLVPRFACIALEQISIQPSPQTTQQILTDSGIRPLNNVIDISNLLTLMYGQPVHIFDLDKIAHQTLVLRASKKGERLTTLDGQTHVLKGDDIVIADGDGRLTDLCGIMGGKLSEVDASTNRALLFVQTYSPTHIRRTSLYTQQRTLAAQIFEKQPDPELVLPTLIQGVKLLQKRTGGQIGSRLIDIYPHPPQTKTVDLDLNWLQKFAGIKISPAKTRHILTSLGFKVNHNGTNRISCLVPTWRLHDISIREDLAEEITRVYGYFRLPSRLPNTTNPDTSTDPLLDHEYTTRQYLTHLGFTEIYNQSLVSPALFDPVGLSLTKTLRLQNPLSSELEYLRPSLIPSLLQNLKDNRGKATLPLLLFELANVYLPKKGQDLPDEIPTLTLSTQGLDPRTTKGYLQALAQKLHLSFQFSPLKNNSAPFIISQSAHIKAGDKTLGIIGPVSTQPQTIIADLNFKLLSSLINPIYKFQPIPKFPSVFEDLTVTSKQPVNQLLNRLRKSSKLIVNVTYLTTHLNKHSFRLEFNHPSRNLTQKEVNQLKQKLLKL